MLANLVTDLKTQTVISAIVCADGTLTSEPSSILQDFTNYFGEMHEATQCLSDKGLQEFVP